MVHRLAGWICLVSMSPKHHSIPTAVQVVHGRRPWMFRGPAFVEAENMATSTAHRLAARKQHVGFAARNVPANWHDPPAPRLQTTDAPACTHSSAGRLLERECSFVKLTERRDPPFEGHQKCAIRRWPPLVFAYESLGPSRKAIHCYRGSHHCVFPITIQDAHEPFTENR